MELADGSRVIGSRASLAGGTLALLACCYSRQAEETYIDLPVSWGRGAGGGQLALAHQI